jgi:hypothetical protein
MVHTMSAQDDHQHGRPSIPAEPFRARMPSEESRDKDRQGMSERSSAPLSLDVSLGIAIVQLEKAAGLGGDQAVCPDERRILRDMVVELSTMRDQHGNSGKNKRA